MTALVCERYGGPDVLKFVQRARPAPKPGEVLIRVLASSITSGDRRVRSMDVPRGFGTLGRLALGWSAPRNPVLGATFAGVVQALGSGAKGFAPGEAVFGISGFRMGGHAEYVCIPATAALAHKPAHLSFEQAAALPFGGGTAMSFLRRAKLLPSESILVNGASGNVGLAAVQLASHMGGAVTGVCSAAKAGLVQSLGAAHVIDYAQMDFTALSERFDVVFDTVCNYPVASCLPVLKPGGRLIRLLSDLPELLGAMVLPHRSGRQVIAGTAEEKADDLKYLADLAAHGRYQPVISRIFPFEQAIEAHRYADRPGKCGSVLVKLK
ncbi:MAG: NAD(P)-dependent alcohol dehydrogenase [Polaromonas sp.]